MIDYYVHFIYKSNNCKLLHTMEKSAFRHGPQTAEKQEVNVSEEDLFHLFVDEQPIVSLFASPRNLKELMVGFIASEGIANYKDISRIDITGCEIWVKTRKRSREDFKPNIELRTSGCSGILQAEPEPIKSKQKFNKNIILDSLKYLDKSSGEWRLTGGTHSASLISDDGGFLHSFEDVGRHNAVDKVIGWALINNQKLDDKFILFTGRLSSGIVTKISRVGIPLIVSNTAPFHRAIDMAERLNVTLIGFARHPQFTVYSNFWRIT